MTNEQLISTINALKAGDRSAFTPLYKEHYSSLYFYLLKVTKDRDSAEDIAQESFMTSLERIGELRDPLSYKTWLFTIASNLSKKHFREQNRFCDFSTEEELDDALEQAGDFSAPMMIPSDYLENKEVQMRVRAAIDSLPEMQRACLVMFYYENMRINEIAEALNITRASVNHRLAAARATIGESVKDLRSDSFSFVPLPLIFEEIGKNVGIITAVGGTGTLSSASAAHAAPSVPSAAAPSQSFPAQMGQAAPSQGAAPQMGHSAPSLPAQKGASAGSRAAATGTDAPSLSAGGAAATSVGVKAAAAAIAAAVAGGGIAAGIMLSRGGEDNTAEDSVPELAPVVSYEDEVPVFDDSEDSKAEDSHDYGSMTDEEAEVPTEPAAPDTWQESYIDYIDNFNTTIDPSDKDRLEYYLTDLNADGTPELIIRTQFFPQTDENGETFSGGTTSTTILTYDNEEGLVKYEREELISALYYIPSEGKIYLEDFVMGGMSTEYFVQLTDGEFSELGIGRDGQEPQDDGRWVAHSYWNDELLDDFLAYKAQVAEVYDKNNDESIFSIDHTENALDSESMKELIENY